MILLRTTRIDADAEAFADTLEAASGDRVVMLVDERHTPSAPTPRLKVSLTDEKCRAFGLHVPKDFAWRCGDYGFYLARAQFPDEQSFWMIEYDVRITGDVARFFATCAAHRDIAVLATHFRPTAGDWWWYATVTASDARPHRAFFPVVRLSSAAIDTLAAKRRAHSRRLLRRALWANDESFVATAAVAAGLRIADLNGLGERFYDEATYSYDNVLDGRVFACDEPDPRLHHPVLYGDDYIRKMHRATGIDSRHVSVAERGWRKLIATLNGRTRW